MGLVRRRSRVLLCVLILLSNDLDPERSGCLLCNLEHRQHYRLSVRGLGRISRTIVRGTVDRRNLGDNLIVRAEYVILSHFFRHHLRPLPVSPEVVQRGAPDLHRVRPDL